MALKAVIGAVSALWSVISCRCPQPLPSWWRALTAEMTRSGTESAKASPIAVAALVTPGPVISMQTPGLPESRA